METAQVTEFFQRLNQRYIDILQSTNPDKLHHLSEQLSASKQALHDLKSSIHQKHRLLTKIEPILSVSAALERNMDKYLIDILSDRTVHANYLILKSVFNQDIQESWNEQYEKLTAFSARGLAIKAINKASRPAVRIYRALTPQIMQDIVDFMAPETLDSESREMLDEFAQQAIDQINSKIRLQNNQIYESIRILINQLPDDPENPSDKSRLLNELTIYFDKEDISYLTEIHLKTTAFCELADNFQNMLSDFRFYRDQLIKINHIEDEIKIFNLQYSGLLVKISNFLAKYISLIFESPTAKQINQLNELKEPYERLKSECEEQINGIKTAVQSKDNVDSTIKDALNHELEAAPHIPTHSIIKSRVVFFAGIRSKNTDLMAGFEPRPLRQ